MELVHLENVLTVSISFLLSQLTTEATSTPCPLCGSGECGEGIYLVYVPRVGHLKPDLQPAFSHYRCLSCAATFISPSDYFVMQDIFKSRHNIDFYMTKPSSMHKLHNPKIDIPH